MPECECGRWVSTDYLRVFAPDDLEAEGVVRACPGCEAIRESNGIRQARAPAGEANDGGRA